MCLSNVTDKAEKPKAHGHGWKMFCRTRAGNLYGVLYGPCGATGYNMRACNRYKPGTTHEAVIRELGMRYPSGFHIYRRRVDAENAYGSSGKVVRRVRWSHQLALGVQRRREKGLCVVAKYMTILPEKGDAKPRKVGMRR